MGNPYSSQDYKNDGMSKKGSGIDAVLSSAKASLESGFSNLLPEINKPTSRRTKATVLVMLSHDYNHFEAHIELTGEDIPLADIDDARKDCQRLCDKAVGQYKAAKQQAVKRANDSYERVQLAIEVSEIRKKEEQNLTTLDKAKVKALADYDHQRIYNYDDDDLYHAF